MEIAGNDKVYKFQLSDQMAAVHSTTCEAVQRNPTSFEPY